MLLDPLVRGKRALLSFGALFVPWVSSIVGDFNLEPRHVTSLWQWHDGAAAGKVPSTGPLSKAPTCQEE